MGAKTRRSFISGQASRRHAGILTKDIQGVLTGGPRRCPVQPTIELPEPVARATESWEPTAPVPRGVRDGKPTTLQHASPPPERRATRDSYRELLVIAGVSGPKTRQSFRRGTQPTKRPLPPPSHQSHRDLRQIPSIHERQHEIPTGRSGVVQPIGRPMQVFYGVEGAEEDIDRDRIPVLPLPHHQACGSAPGGSVS